MRSGMRSWSKCVIFSRRMKSSSSVGPRSPAFSEFWLSAMATPWLVVSTWPPPSARTRSSEPIVAFTPGRGVLSPVLSEGFDSLSVLAVTAGEAGSACRPSGGCTALSRPSSSGLLAFHGICATNACVSAACSACASPAPLREGTAGRPLVLREAALAATASDAGLAGFFTMKAP